MPLVDLTATELATLAAGLRVLNDRSRKDSERCGWSTIREIYQHAIEANEETIRKLERARKG